MALEASKIAKDDQNFDKNWKVFKDTQKIKNLVHKILAHIIFITWPNFSHFSNFFRKLLQISQNRRKSRFFILAIYWPILVQIFQIIVNDDIKPVISSKFSLSLQNAKYHKSPNYHYFSSIIMTFHIILSGIWKKNTSLKSYILNHKREYRIWS